MQYRVYLKPFDDDGNYLSDFIEITNDVISMSDIQVKVDGSEYDVGIIKNSGVNITLRNDQGLYSEPTNIRSVFRTKRKNAIVKITWSILDKPLICGFFNCGYPLLGEETILFEGVLNETSSSIDISKQQISFTVLGYESLLDELVTPYASISNGDNLSAVILTMINQPPFNQLVTVSGANINLGFNTSIDDKTEMEAKTVGENLKDILLAANSVLYIKNNIVYVTSRAASADLKFTFYGQGATVGIENVLNIPKYRDGLNRTFNYWVWSETNLVQQDPSSVEIYGALKKEISLSIITNSTKRNNILDANRLEFSMPKTELEVVTPINYETLALQILDKVNVDYPTVFTPSDNNPLPRYGAVFYGVSRYPYGQFTLTIDSARRFKILGKKLSKNKNYYTFTLREV